MEGARLRECGRRPDAESEFLQSHIALGAAELCDATLLSDAELSLDAELGRDAELSPDAALGGDDEW